MVLDKLELPLLYITVRSCAKMYYLQQKKNINKSSVKKTSCARGDTICPLFSPTVGAPAPRAPPSRRNVAVVSHAQYVLTVTAAIPQALRPRWVKRPGDLDLWHFYLESGIRVTCDVGYLSANFSLPRPLCSRLRPDVRYRCQTASSLNAPAY